MTESFIRERSVALAAVFGVTVVSLAAGPVLAAPPGRHIERAHAVWSVGTDLGRARYEIEARRVTFATQEPITTGYMATRVCLPASGPDIPICIASVALKRVHDDRLEMDPALSSASFRMRFAGTRHGATWDASGSSPEVDIEGTLEGDPAVERSAEADGTAFGTGLSAEAVRDAVVERGSESGDLDPPPAPWALLPGLGGRSSVSSSSCWTYRPKERGFARAMNEERVAREMGRMRLDPELSRAARVHTREMIDADLLHHTSSTSLRRRVTNWTVLGENVGVGGTVGSLHAAFMASPAHKDNILYSPFKYVGIGTATGLGRLWVTVIFESRKDPGTRLRMPRC